jgi:YHS domain-containing protein
MSVALFLLCAGFCWQEARGSDGEAIAWRDDYGQALEEARAANRLLWVQFTGPWCPHCVRMERETFPHRAIVERARESFVPLSLRADVHQQLVQSFNLATLPATVIIAPNRDIIAVQQGYLGPDDLDAFLRDALARRPRSGAAVTSSSDSDGHAAGGQGNATEGSNETLALAGFCTVSPVCDRKLVAGKARYTVHHEGPAYRFASLEMSARFRKEPERYVPANDGCCAVTRLQQGVKKPGEPKWGVVRRAPVPLRDRSRPPGIPGESRTVCHGRRRRIRLLRPLHPRVRNPGPRRPAPRGREKRLAVLVSRYHASRRVPGGVELRRTVPRETLAAKAAQVERPLASWPSRLASS